MQNHSRGRNLLILLGLCFAYSLLMTPLALVWTNKVVSHGTYENTPGEILFRTVDLLPSLIIAIAVGVGARIYLLSGKVGGWLAALGLYVGVAHYASYRGIFKPAAVSFRLAAALESAVLVGGILAGAAIVSRRSRVGAA